jgi:hypothetical protein
MFLARHIAGPVRILDFGGYWTQYTDAIACYAASHLRYLGKAADPQAQRVTAREIAAQDMTSSFSATFSSIFHFRRHIGSSR